VADEIQLEGGALTDGVVRVGDTVRRPARFGTHLMREVLAHLERVGFDAAPRWLGFDEQDRDVLSWIEGDTYTDRSQMHPYLGTSPDRLTFNDQQLVAVMQLLRRYHDTFGGEVICHGDYGPWNIVWRNRMPVAILDFDNVHAGGRGEDVAYALRMFLSYGLVDTDADILIERTRTAIEAYGDPFDVAAILDREYDLAEERCRRNGWHRQLGKLPTERAWLASHRSAVSRGIAVDA
jgi:Ser/Thr protein kinase RdoA (MazF antagonist)